MFNLNEEVILIDDNNLSVSNGSIGVVKSIISNKIIRVKWIYKKLKNIDCKHDFNGGRFFITRFKLKNIKRSIWDRV